MKLSKLIYVLILITLIACIPKTKVVSVQSHGVSGENLFSEAENLLNSKKYNRALETYSEYIAQFPGSHLIPAALMRMGTIYYTLGENEKARNTYMSLITDYPKSNYASDVKIKIIEEYLEDRLFKEAINYSTGILTENLSDYHVSKIYILTGDAQIAIKRNSDAVISYFKAGLKSTERERGIVDIKLKDSIAQLGINGIISLIESIKDDSLKGYLQYQLGLRYYENKKYNEAADVLHDFTQKMPAHRNAGEGKSLLQEIYAKAGSKSHTVGCLLPLTGAFNVFGNKALKGAALALNNFSNKTGHTFNIVIRDTESNPEKAAAAVDELIKENVSAIIGPMGSAESVSAANKAHAGNVPIILLSQKENITDIGDFVFRNFLMPEMQVRSLVEYAVTQKGIKKFAILYPKENYGITFMKLFQDEVKANGGKIIRVESYDPALMDFTNSIRMLAGSRNVSGSNMNVSQASDKKQKKSDELPVEFEAVFIPDSPAKAGLIIPQLAYLDIRNVYLLGTNLWHSQKMIEMAGEFLEDWAIIPDGFHGENDSEKVREFVNSFAGKYGEEPGFVEAVAYDTAMMLFQIMSMPNVRVPGSVRNELVKIKNYKGLTGLTSFNGSGDAWKKLYLLTISRGRFTELKTE